MLLAILLPEQAFHRIQYSGGGLLTGLQGMQLPGKLRWKLLFTETDHCIDGEVAIFSVMPGSGASNKARRLASPGQSDA